MTHTKKFSAALAVVVVGFLSIYATFASFNSSNQTSYQLNITLDMQSGAQVPVSLAPGQTIPTNLNGDVIIGLDFNGQHDPAGANAIMQSPFGGTIKMMWQMAGGQPMGVVGGWQDTETIS